MIKVNEQIVQIINAAMVLRQHMENGRPNPAPNLDKKSYAQVIEGLFDAAHTLKMVQAIIELEETATN